MTSGELMQPKAQPILVTGAHRSGTTWVGKILAASDSLTYISEPLNVLHRPGVNRAPVTKWYPYICVENENDFLPALRDMLSFRYHLWLEFRSLRSPKDVLRMVRDSSRFVSGYLRKQIPLIKDPFAVFSAPWFAERLNCKVVITVRHPAAFTSSIKRLGWHFDFNDLLSQPLLMRDWLEPYRIEMETTLADDIIGQSSLLWRMIYFVVDKYHHQHPEFITVHHEDLSKDPVYGYRQLYASLELEYTYRIQNAVIDSSSSDNPKEASKKDRYAIKLDSRSSLDNWKHRLSHEEIDRISHLTRDVSSIYYPNWKWE